MNTASKWTYCRWFGVAALAVASGTAGWSLGQRAHDGRGPVLADIADPRVATVPRALEAPESGAAIQAPADGTASGHVERVAAGWQLLELGAVGPVATDIDAVSESSCELAAKDTGAVNVERLERTLTEGTESERHAALTQALEAGIDLPPELLRQTYASDPSDSVRLLAFATYLDSMSDDRIEVRDALQSGVYDGSPALQAEAQRRLAELEQFERTLAEISSRGLP